MAMQEVKLNLINRSNDENNSSVVIFQKNIANKIDNTTVAWRVIQNCETGKQHTFVFPLQFQVCANDSLGNYTPKLNAHDGQNFAMVEELGGNILTLGKHPALFADEVEIENSLVQTPIGGNVYRDGKLLAVKPNLKPGQKATFQFQPSIFIGVNSEVEEGELIDLEMISQASTEIDLLGIESADIVMTKSPANTDLFEFTLENISRAETH